MTISRINSFFVSFKQLDECFIENLIFTSLLTMELLSTVLFIVLLKVVALNAVKDGCDPWPSNLTAITFCCEVPNTKFWSPRHAGKCESKCDKVSAETQSDCAAECIATEAGLVKNNDLDKSKVKLHLNSMMRESFAATAAPTEKQLTLLVQLLNEAVEKCEFKSTEKMSHDLAIFYDCVETFMAHNCLLHDNYAICDASVVYNEKCRKHPTNCSEWPDPRYFMTADFNHCCRSPNIIASDHYSKFMTTCQKKEFLSHKRFECMYNETIAESGVKDIEHFDFEVVRKMLIESANKTLKWEKPIDDAIETCSKEIKGKLICFSTFNRKLNFFLSNEITKNQ